jgi:hypothetical protein
MSDEHYTVSAALPGDQIADGVFRLSDAEQDIGLSFELPDRKLNARAGDYFEALAAIRRELEKDDIFLNCYGASRNVYPSGMGRDMGAGLRAYKLTVGKHATMEDLVFIFDTGADVEPCSVLEQRDFFEMWLKSTRA